MANGQQDAVKNYSKFKNWTKTRTEQDFLELERRGILNRTQMAKECEFAVSVFRQNPRVKRRLLALEIILHKRGILTAKPKQSSPNKPSLLDQEQHQRERTANKNKQLESSVTELIALNRDLNDQNERLEAENAEHINKIKSLERELARYKKLDALLGDLGRLPW